MTIEQIIDTLNKHISALRKSKNIHSKSHLVLQKIALPHKTFKAYKDIEFILWYVDGKDKCRVITLRDNYKVLQGQEDTILDKISEELVNNIFTLYQSNYMNEIINGTYKE